MTGMSSCPGPLAREGGGDLGTRIAGCPEPCVPRRDPHVEALPPDPPRHRRHRREGGKPRRARRRGRACLHRLERDDPRGGRRRARHRSSGAAPDHASSRVPGARPSRRTSIRRRGVRPAARPRGRGCVGRLRGGPRGHRPTADPHRIEQIHREAFARLTPSQRAHVDARMRAELPAEERPRSSSADDLARAAGRAEAVQPGRLRGLLSRTRGGGAAVAAGGAAVGLLGVVAGGAVVSAVAAPLLEQAAGLGVDFDALAQGIDLDALASGVDIDALAGGADEILGSAGEVVSGLGETATGWGERLGDLGIPGIGDILGR
ncbi:unnamed protein product [Penicillium discolor]